MGKVLIITYYWPPAGGPGVQRWLYFVRYLHKMGAHPVVFIPETPHYPIIDKDLVALVPEGVPVYRSRFWEPYGLAGLLGSRTTKRVSAGMIEKERPGVTERLMRWVRGNFFIPDARKYWLKPALRELPEILAKEGIDSVVTTGPPHSVHLIGMALKEKVSIRWVADFRDPWTQIGYHEHLYLSGPARRKHERLEKQVLQAADAVVATSGTTAGAFRKQTTKPVHVITNGFDQPPADGSQPEGPFRLVHIGSLLAGRNPEALWRILKRMTQTHPDFGKDLSLELTGLVSEEVTRSLEASGLMPWVRTFPYVPHQEAMQALRQAQILLLLEIDLPETRGILPGKLYEYMAAARPVLAIGPSGWEAAEIVAGTGCGAAFEYAQEQAIEKQIREWYTAYKAGTLTGNTRGIGDYHRQSLTRKLANDVLWESS